MFGVWFAGVNFMQTNHNMPNVCLSGGSDLANYIVCSMPFIRFLVQNHTNYLAMTLPNCILWFRVLRIHCTRPLIAGVGGGAIHRKSKKWYETLSNEMRSIHFRQLRVYKLFMWMRSGRHQWRGGTISHNLFLCSFRRRICIHALHSVWMLYDFQTMTLWRSVNALRFTQRACINPSNVIVGRRRCPCRHLRALHPFPNSLQYAVWCAWALLESRPRVWNMSTICLCVPISVGRRTKRIEMDR